MKKIGFKLVGIFVLLLIIISSISGFLIDIQWFKEVGYLNVFFTSFKAKLTILIPSFLIFFLAIYFYAKFLAKNYLEISDIVYDKNDLKRRNKVLMIISFVISIIISLVFTSVFWYRILEYVNGVEFGVNDPIFNIDIGFFVFKLPLIQGILGMLITVVIVLTAVSALFYAFERAREGITNFRGVVWIKDGPKVRFFAKQVAYFAALLLILLAGVFYLRALNLVYSPRGVAFGASYTDVHITLPLYRILSGLSVIAAFVMFYSIVKKRIRHVIYIAVFIVLFILFEGVASVVVERFIVSPNAREKEMPYLEYNIEYTRKAYGLENIVEQEFDVKNNLTPNDIKENKNTIDNIRITEFAQSLEVFNQIQAIRNYYRFNDVDIDRYNIDGKLRQVFIAARELDNSQRDPKFQTWQNKHLFYTHGYGAVMSYTNTVMSTGLPEFLVKDIPVSGKISVDKPQIYFGEINNDYVIINAKNNEIDYPYGSGEKENRYDGKAGIVLNPLNRLLFTLGYADMNFLLSNNIKSDSRIILNRQIVNRVKKIAPFLNYDEDPYIVIANGRYYWIMDAYTTTNRYPYSEPYFGINYIRNSVKVVVDAYDGTVDFYISDKNDPIAQTIGNIYDGLFKDLSTMPEELRKHLRYSEDVFLIQANVYEKYHMKNPVSFYNSEDLWAIARYKNADGSETPVEAVYQVMKLQDDEEFILTIPYTVAKKENMVSWLAARMDKNLGQMVLIRFPKEKAILGPQQFNSRINTDIQISSLITLLNQQGSSVILGETNIIPIENSLLYVRPLYLRAQGGKSVPELKKVIVNYGDTIVMEDNIAKAISKLFATTEVPLPTETKEEDVKTLIIRADEAYRKAVESQKNGDWAGYGNYIKELEGILNKLKEKTK
ncbi:hypothetical protein ABG79_01684 [Caloramator mitchellensis]|uniref:UPF0182 protein ABG79_01684 n=1 Tax=Caloramator mitchellensis TaxID=908809 RepID=A0A0R3JZ06_CALMK|nr:UPF0182 family protein [Caloramator mitchellensis]KRQ86478.1 hypothetical protein ABG79_01684 [Caloramator mitchellensis]